MYLYISLKRPLVEAHQLRRLAIFTLKLDWRVLPGDANHAEATCGVVQQLCTSQTLRMQGCDALSTVCFGDLRLVHLDLVFIHSAEGSHVVVLPIRIR